MRMLPALLALVALAACGSKEDAAPKGSSFGEVLPGSASDAMLPYDTASSAPPLEPRQYGTGDDTGARTSPRAATPTESPEQAQAAPDPLAT